MGSDHTPSALKEHSQTFHGAFTDAHRGGGISERSREPNERTGGTGERPESTSGPLGASVTDRGKGDQRENERTAREHGRNQRATVHDVALICWTLQLRFILFLFGEPLCGKCWTFCSRWLD